MRKDKFQTTMGSIDEVKALMALLGAEHCYTDGRDSGHRSLRGGADIFIYVTEIDDDCYKVTARLQPGHLKAA